MGKGPGAWFDAGTTSSRHAARECPVCALPAELQTPGYQWDWGAGGAHRRARRVDHAPEQPTRPDG
eukprot:5339123-Prymnesium_polylepis.1